MKRLLVGGYHLDFSPTKTPIYFSYKAAKKLWVYCVLICCCLPGSSMAFQPGYLPASSFETPIRPQMTSNAPRKPYRPARGSLLKGLRMAKAEEAEVEAPTKKKTKKKKAVKKKTKKKVGKKSTKKTTKKKTDAKKNTTKKKMAQETELSISDEKVEGEATKEDETKPAEEDKPELAEEDKPQPAEEEDKPQFTQQESKNPPNKATSAYQAPQNNKNQPFKRKQNYNSRGNSNNRRFSNKDNINFAQSRALNQKLTSCESAKEILLLLATTQGALTSPAGGGKMNSVNFSTAVHRIARFLNTPPKRDKNNNPFDQLKRIRAETFIDPRFALFLCSLAEALGGVSYDSSRARSTVSFGSREVSNIAWGLAKVRIAPPQNDCPLLSATNFKTMLLDTAKQVRGQVLQGAKARARDKGSGRLKDDAHYAGLWVPFEALLCGQMIDTIGIRVEQAMNRQSLGEDHDISVHNMAFQERANLLWAGAKSQRASGAVFDVVVDSMVEDMEKQLTTMEDEGGNENAKSRNQKGRHRAAPLQPQEWSNSIWAFATAQVTGAGQERLIKFLANTLETQQGFREMFKPQELSNTAWSVAKMLSEKKALGKGEEDAAVTILRHVAMEVPKRASQFKTQELSNTLWGFATLGFGSSSSVAYAEVAASLNDYVILASDDPEGDEKLVRRATDAILECALPKIEYFKSQELNNLAWSLARLGRKDVTTVLEVIGTELWRGKRKVTPQDIGTTLWSMATLEYLNEDIYRGIASRFRVDRAHQFKPQELSNAVWAMATAEVQPAYPDMFDTVLIPPERQFLGPLHTIDDPVTLCFGVAAQELMRRPYEFKTQEIKDVLWSFSRLGIRHPDLFKATAEHLVGPDKPKKGGRIRGVGDFSPQGLGNMAWAFAKQAQLVEDVNKRTDISASVVSQTGKMAVYATSFFDIGEIMVQRLFSAIAESNLRVHGNLSMLKPQDISNTAWAMAVLGMRHDAFLEASKQQLIERTTRYAKGQGKRDVTYFKAQELANILWAFAIVNFPVDELLGASIAPYMVKSTVGSMNDLSTTGIAPIYKRQELANIAWSCAVLNEYPSSLTKLLYCGLLGLGDERDPQYLRSCYGDAGLQREACMSLIYLQLAMELEGETNGLSLPESFPQGWSRQTLSNSDNNLGDMGFELKLSTSKIQRDVSAALGRIGFDHVEEHVIRLDELLDNEGVELAAAPIEVISIDIANVDARVAVEVDGPAHYVADIETVPSEGGYARVNNGRMEYSFSMNNERHHLNGPTALKKRLLEQMGWTAINVPFWEWYELKGDDVLEDEYCRRIVGELGT